MKFYDTHIHFYFTFPAEELKGAFSQLTRIGLSGFSSLMFPEFPADIKTILKMVQRPLHKIISLQAFEKQKDPFPYIEWAKPLTIIPFADVRFIEKGIEEKMERFKQGGFKGIKLMYAPEEDATMELEGMEEAFGWSLKKSEEVTARLIDSASSRGMCVLFHADLRRYSDYVKEMIFNHPQTNFNVPHFGFSRKAISHMLETCPNCYTDTSALVPFMEDDPVSYRSFVREYQDRILFGSDALIGESEHVEASLRFVQRLLDDQEVLHKLTCKNYAVFHGINGDCQHQLRA